MSIFTYDELVAKAVAMGIPRDIAERAARRQFDSQMASNRPQEAVKQWKDGLLGFEAVGDKVVAMRSIAGHSGVDGENAREDSVSREGAAVLTAGKSPTRVSRPRQMNKLEARRAQQLEAMKRAGIIVDWKYEAITLVLAKRLRYTPDFLVIGKPQPGTYKAEIYDGLEIRFEETKGFWRDDALAKVKMAAELFPFWNFVALKALWPRKGFIPAEGSANDGWTRQAFTGRIDLAAIVERLKQEDG